MNIPIANITVISHKFFYLLGIPGLEDQHIWISVPFFTSYIIAFLGNSFLIFIIVTDHSLHEPMYIFLCMLAIFDLGLSTIIIPKALTIFWFNSGGISLDGCIIQIFFVHSTFIAESGILLIMAFDRYIAICYPLRYTMILKSSVIIKISIAAYMRGIVTVFPLTFLLKKLIFCKNNFLPHTFCEHIGLAKYACVSIHVNLWYGLFVILITIVLDVILIVASYCMILRAIFHMPSQEARLKTLHTCGSHICVILLFYIPAIFTTLVQRYGKSIPPHVHILIANIAILIPPMMNPIIYGIKTKQIRNRMFQHCLRAKNDLRSDG
ncbi:olfactory receptor 52B4-like [Monodelphis domestica]|uniref:olfactory receptor 52B4-like n=1 Tax=Monodelphis domestica TaxID=13616 RepID=UPI0024E23D4A|nr:olfactory receptor 52B4-like [Monodelphis domestica]